MRLKIMAISDTHLGEDISLLSFPQGCQHFWRELREQFGHALEPKDRIDIDEMILIGDIADRALSSTAEIMTATTSFVQMLGSAANIKKCVYVPGNHDHTIWTDYLKKCQGKDREWGCTSPKGEFILESGEPKNLESSEDLLATFFGYPYGSSWLKIKEDRNLDFLISNPLYSTQVGCRTYVFTHGSHFKKEVTDPLGITAIRLLDVVDKFLVGIEIKSGCDVTKGCDCLEELEKEVAPFIDSLWISSKNNPTSKSDRYWYILKLLSNIERDSRDLSDKSKLFSLKDLKVGSADGRIRKLTQEGLPSDESVQRWKTYFLPQMLNYLREHNELQDEMTFIYGDTHNGGWGELSESDEFDLNGSIRVYNTGGWIAHRGEGHPACHIFAVDDEGGEYMLDISFSGVKVGEDLLIDLASKDVENNNNLLCYIPKKMIDLCKQLSA